MLSPKWVSHGPKQLSTHSNHKQTHNNIRETTRQTSCSHNIHETTHQSSCSHNSKKQQVKKELYALECFHDISRPCCHNNSPRNIVPINESYERDSLDLGEVSRRRSNHFKSSMHCDFSFQSDGSDSESYVCDSDEQNPRDYRSYGHESCNQHEKLRDKSKSRDKSNSRDKSKSRLSRQPLREFSLEHNLSNIKSKCRLSNNKHSERSNNCTRDIEPNCRECFRMNYPLEDFSRSKNNSSSPRYFNPCACSSPVIRSNKKNKSGKNCAKFDSFSSENSGGNSGDQTAKYSDFSSVDRRRFSAFSDNFYMRQKEKSPLPSVSSCSSPFQLYSSPLFSIPMADHISDTLPNYHDQSDAPINQYEIIGNGRSIYASKPSHISECIDENYFSNCGDRSNEADDSFLLHDHSLLKSNLSRSNNNISRTSFESPSRINSSGRYRNFRHSVSVPSEFNSASLNSLFKSAYRSDDTGKRLHDLDSRSNALDDPCETESFINTENRYNPYTLVKSNTKPLNDSNNTRNTCPHSKQTRHDNSHRSNYHLDKFLNAKACLDRLFKR